MPIDEPARILFAMIDENTFDNLVFVREDIETRFPKVEPKNISDVISILINYWYDQQVKL
jgi:hypothetical protein